MNTARPIPDLLRRWLAPARWPLSFSRVICVFVLLWSVLLVGSIANSLLLLALGFAAIGILYVSRRAARRRIIKRYCLDPATECIDLPIIRRARRWFVICTILLVFRVPFHAAFVISRPFLNRLAHHEYAVKPWDAPRPEGTTLAGLFPVRINGVTPIGVGFEVWMGGMFYSEGPDGAPRWKFYCGEDPYFDLPW